VQNRAPAKSFRDLGVWQKAHEFVLQVYRLSAGFPRAEAYGLTSQLQRAAASVPANIVEGFRRRGRPEKARFMNIAEASLDEATYFLVLAHDLGYADTGAAIAQAETVSRILRAYTNAILAEKD
jgi:four helix bundle protein